MRCTRGSAGLPLERVHHLLQLYVEGLTGNEIEIAPLAAVPLESRIADGRTIHLPSLVAEFGDDDLDFRLVQSVGCSCRRAKSNSGLTSAARPN